MASGIILWCAAAALCVLLHILAGQAWSFAVLVLVVLIPPVSSVLALAAKKCAGVTLFVPPSGEKHHAATAYAELKNDSVLPLFCVRAEITAENRLTGQTQKLTLRLSAPPRKTVRSAFTMNSDFCGSIVVRMTRVRVFGGFPLLGFPIDGGKAQTLCVAPNTFEMQLNLPLRTGACDESDNYSMEKPGADYTETFQIREYREGDSVKQIHWKLTQKFDRLIVRDPALPLERSVLVLWERGGEQSPRQIDAMAEVLTSLCRELCRQSVSCKAVWNEEETDGCAVCEMQDEGELYAMLPKLLGARLVTGGDGVVQRYLKLYGLAGGSKVIYLAAQPCPLLSELAPEQNVTCLLCDCAQVSDYGRSYLFDSADYASALFEVDLYEGA